MMKTWLAVVLAVMLCFAGTAAMAECTHENAYRSDEWKNSIYESTGDPKYHTRKYDLYRYMYCPDCSSSYDEKLIAADQESTQTHSWESDGVCRYCHQQNDCTHPKAYESAVFFLDHDESTGDPQTHLKCGYEYTQWHCPDCYLDYGRSENGEWKEVEENHWWNDGVCGGCHQENGCQHEKTTSGITNEHVAYEQTGDSQKHKVIYDVYRVTDCDDCGVRVSREYLGQEEDLVNHNWDDRGVVCLSCGYESVCAHEQTRTETFHDSSDYYQTGSTKTHQHKKNYDTHEYCVSCGYLVSRTYSHSGYSDEKHNWNEYNKCRNCGQANVCVHDGGTESQTEETNYHYENINDPKLHRYACDVYTVTACSNCGEALSRAFKETKSWEYTHNWNSQNICRQCGQVNVCTHSGETTKGTESDNYRYESMGDPGYHRRLYDDYEVTRCADCGEELSRIFKEVYFYENRHDWNNNACRDCGQKNSCQHEKTTETTNQINTSYTRIDDKTHRCAFTMNIRKQCTACYLYVDEREGGEYELVERHNWDEDGVCWDCDAQSSCAHVNTGERNYDEERVYTDLGDGVNHSVQETAEVYTYCYDCRRRISDYRTVTSEYTEEHANMYSCWECGYEKECPHANGSYELVDWLDMRYIALDEKKHVCYGKTETHVYCSDCEREISVVRSEEEELLVTQDHSWNDRNICDVCEYVNPSPCTHSNTDVALAEAYGGLWIAQNEAMHTRTVICKEMTYCTDCGEKVGEISALKQVVQTEPHYFWNGKCDCGYKNGCAHGGATHTEKYPSNWWGQAICIDDKTHKIDAIYCVETYCDLCGDIIAEEELPRQLTIAEHEMYGGRCELCDYQIDCAHKNTVKQLVQKTNYLFCEAISDNAHTATYEQYWVDYCEDCDMQIGERVYAGVKKVNEPHDMASGCCVKCGYCGHPADKIRKNYKSLGSENIKYNQYMHISVEIYQVTETCQQCGGVADEYVTASYGTAGIYTLHHYGENGICDSCGYANPCKHNNARRKQDGYSTTYEDAGNGAQHWATKREKTYMYCPDCMYIWDHQEGEPVTSVENHDYYWSKYGEIRDMCSKCKYDSGNSLRCKHSNTADRAEYDDWVIEYADEQYHNEYRKNKYKVTECLDCGLELSRVLEHEGLIFQGKEKHSIGTECSCGYVNPCEHNNTVLGAIYGWEGYSRPVDETHHKRIQLVQMGVLCADCGLELSGTSDLVEMVVYEEHEFNEFGDCEYCSYENRCKHLETRTNDAYTVYSSREIDDVWHEVTHGVEKRVECVSCGQLIESQCLEKTTENQKHTDSGSCSVCGWLSDGHVCNRAPTRKVIEATAIDAQNHRAQIEVGASWHCEGCGSGGENVSHGVETVVEPHRFTDLGRCADCGYVNFCAHEQTYEKPVYHNPVGYEMKDEHEHTFVSEVTKEVRCTNCEHLVSYTAQMSADCTEAHVFDDETDALCDRCGYERVILIEPTPTPTDAFEPQPTPSPQMPQPQYKMVLPSGLQVIDREAFAGSGAEAFAVAEGCLYIESCAFANCPNLLLLELPKSILGIADDALQGCCGFVIAAPKGSYAIDYAQRLGYAYIELE